MLYLDLADTSSGKGHLLSTDGKTGDEFKIEWRCATGEVRWGAMWKRDREFNQLERSPAPNDLKVWHAARNDSERRVVEIACAPPAKRLSLRSAKTERSPIPATAMALEAVHAGKPPKDALFEALGVNISASR